MTSFYAFADQFGSVLAPILGLVVLVSCLLVIGEIATRKKRHADAQFRRFFVDPAQRRASRQKVI